MLPKNFDYDGLIDKEIMDIITDINKLPFVEETTNCCAGYGLNYKGKKHDAFQGSMPYLALSYNDKGYEKFHTELSMVAYQFNYFPSQGHFVYYLFPSVQPTFCGTKNKYCIEDYPNSKAYITSSKKYIENRFLKGCEEKWGAVRGLVERELLKV